MRRLSADEVRWLRVRAQGVDGGSATDGGSVRSRAGSAGSQAGVAAGSSSRSPSGGAAPIEAVAAAVRRSAAIQAQAVPPARLAIRARTAGLHASDVDAACREASVVRTWLMRGTLHMVAADDLRAYLSLLGPVNLRNGRRRRDQLGLTDELCDRALTAFAAILAGGKALTRAELVVELAAHGVVIDPKTQAPPHLLGFAANSGLICRGPEADRDEPTYVLIDDWLGPAPAPDRDEALALLARRYFAAYGPATVADLTGWSGLPAADCKAAVALVRDTLDEVEHDGARLLLPADAADPAPPERPHRLLGQFDAYLLGHRSRDLVLDPADAKRVNAGGGMIAATMLVSGRVVGTWTAGGLEPFTDLPPDVMAEFDAEVEDVDRFRLVW